MNIRLNKEVQDKLGAALRELNMATQTVVTTQQAMNTDDENGNGGRSGPGTPRSYTNAFGEDSRLVRPCVEQSQSSIDIDVAVNRSLSMSNDGFHVV